MQKIKVLMIEHFGGENLYTYCLCSSLSQRNIDLTVVTTSSFIKSNDGFNVLRYYPAYEKSHKSAKILKYLAAIIKTLYLIITERFDVIHFQTFRRESIEWIIFLFISHIYKNTVFTCHNVFPHEVTKYKAFIYKRVYHSAKEIIVHNNFAYRALKDILLRNEKEKISIIPHGNYSYYAKIASRSIKPRLQQVCNPGALKLMVFGVMREYKGLDILLRAFEGVKDKNVRLIICGRAKQDYQKEHEYLSKVLGIGGSIIFDWGEIPNEQVASTVSIADVLVFPYKNIYQSGALMLAYTFGKPVIVSSIEGFKEDVIQNLNGYKIDFSRKEEFTDLIGYLVSNRHELERIGKYNKNLAQTKYDWENISGQTMKVYKRIINHS